MAETSHDDVARCAFRLPVPAGATSAFYTCIGVLPEYRGLCLPIRLMIEARRQFVEPRKIQYTWLLYDADRTRSTRLCRIMKYSALPEIHYDLGRPCRVLFRQEPSASVSSPARTAHAVHSALAH